MKLLINGMDITYTEQSMKICNYGDYAGGHADTLKIVMNDTYDEWKEWGLNKGDRIQAQTDLIDTGEMYVSEIGITEGHYYIKALSTKVNSLQETSYIKENITLDEILSQTVMDELGYTLKKYQIDNYLYPYIERSEKNPIEYLNFIARNEGYLIKIYDNQFIIYDEKKMENQEAKIIVNEIDFINKPDFSSSDSKMIAEIKNSYLYRGTLISTIVSSNRSGMKKRLQLPVSSISESTRFTKNIMRSYNKYEFVGTGKVDAIPIAAGQVIMLDGSYGDWSGRNFVYEVTHDLIYGTKKLHFRRTLEGDY